MRFNVAGRIGQRIELLGETAQLATETVLEAMLARMPGMQSGAITVDRCGGIGVYWTTEKMAWAWRRADEVRWGIRRGEDFGERIA